MKSLILLGSVALLAGCASPKLVGRPDLTIVQQSGLPAPTQANLVDAGRPYLLGPSDRLAIEVFGADTISRTLQADADGRIALPLAGELDVIGKTPAQLAQEIAGRLRGRYVKNPQVTVNLVEAANQTVSVSGQVVEPGLYPVVGRMTLMRAIARAKGASEFAKLSHVVVFRTVGDREMAGLYDLQAIEQGIYPDPEVYARDKIVVGDNVGRRVFRDFLQGSGLLTAPLIAILN